MKKLVALVALATAFLTAGVYAQQSATVSFNQPGNIAAVDFGATAAPNPPKASPTSKKKAAPGGHDDVSKKAAKPVDASLAVKATPAPAVDLPGVAKTDGADAAAIDFSRSRVVPIDNGGSKTIWLSSKDQNRIQLPWANTRVVGTDELVINKNKTSNNVYIFWAPDRVQRPVQVYFEDPNSSVVLGAQLVPQEIPAQTIIVRDATRGGRQVTNKANSYISEVQARMESAALGSAPSGYSEMDANIPPVVMNGLVITTQKIYSSGTNDIYVYDVANPGPLTATLTEEEFDGQNVTAVSIYPTPLLNAKEHARVIVEATRKEQ